ncbi:EF-hand calcium-binding domain-containing protein 1 [Mugil cephalus]|uniref:EF-hand calcium-binding domain-containing protein 1 n=1 Tax=Mugil cephalus TaxID=48193 RepID=UPI001FB6D49C|nr:EF-hand calcium-binding domain-containing protein 1 [Mugil cephalus]
MSQMSNKNKKVVQNLAKSISKEVKHFNKIEVEGLIGEYEVLMQDMSNYGREVPGLERGKFRSKLHSMFGITHDIIMDGVFKTFDKDNDGHVTMREWIEGLSVFLRGNMDEQIKFCFHVFDLNGDGYISREEMLQLMKNSLILATEEESEEGIKDLVEITLNRMDHDHDGKLSFEDFEKAIKEENLLLTAFGPCLPDYKSIEKFEQRVFYVQLFQ